MAGYTSFNAYFSKKLSCGIEDFPLINKYIYVIRDETSSYIMHGYEDEIQHVLLVLKEKLNLIGEYKVLFKYQANNLQPTLDFLKTEKISIEEGMYLEITLPHLKMFELYDVWYALEVIPEEIYARLLKSV